MAFTQADLDDAAKRHTGLLSGHDLGTGFTSWCAFDDGGRTARDYFLATLLAIVSFPILILADVSVSRATGLDGVIVFALLLLAGPALLLLLAVVESRSVRPYTVRFATAAQVLDSVRLDAGRLSGSERDHAVAQIDLLAERLCGVDGLMTSRVGCDLIDSAARDALVLAGQVKADIARVRQSAILADAAHRFDTPEAQRWAARQVR
jgi:hypothetical protein